MIMAQPRRRAIWQMLSLASIAAYQLAGCGEENGPTIGRGRSILDEVSPFAKPKRSPAPTCAAADRDAAIAAWAKLRSDDYPYHLQAVALSPAFPSGCRALIIGEPPPAVSLQALQAVAPPLLARSEIQQHKIGYDGWTRDVVVTLPPVQDAELTELIAALHSALFETTYRMAALDTSEPAPKLDPKLAPLDVGIGPGELRRWLLMEPSSFTPLGGGEPAAFKDLLAADEPEVYLDDAHGLVVWIVPRRSDVAEMAGLFRQFTLESDIIVGAVASRTTVAIVARQRAVDPRVLQPLRFETVSLLAAVHDRDALQQSYERTNPLAGRIDDTRDWAPIFLSPELLDTEYGSVLDIADQFLKSWSNNGKTQYINFSYPAPRSWAFPAPVPLVAKAGSFRYNWNTTNVGAVVKIDDDEVFWLRRTGALNVSYFPDEDELAEHQPPKPSGVQELEEKAYQFFVQTQTPILVRVVQYNALFQIFARFGIASSMTAPTTSDARAAQTLVSAAHGALTAIRDAGDAEIERRTSDVVAELRKQLMADLKTLSHELAKLDADGLAELARLIGDPRSATGARSDLFVIHKQVTALGQLFAWFAKPGVYMAYAENAPARLDTWIHTPSVVISWNQLPLANAVGGHDLVARLPTLEFHPEKASLAATQLAAHRTVDAVGARELDRLELGPHGPRLAPASTSRSARPALGTRSHGFWQEPGRKPPAARVAPGARGPVVTKLSDGYRVVDRSGTVHEVTTTPDVVERVIKAHGAKGEDVVIQFEGFRPDEARGVAHAVELKTRARVAGVVSSPEFPNRPIHFSKAVLRDTQTRSYRDGSGAIGHVIHVPGDKPLSIEVKVAVPKATGVLGRFAAGVRTVIQRVIRRFSGKPAPPRDFGIELRNQLRDLLQDAPRDPELRDHYHIEIKMKQEAHDSTTVQRELPMRHGIRDLAG
jgi:hypothetical protein